MNTGFSYEKDFIKSEAIHCLLGGNLAQCKVFLYLNSV